MLNLFTLLVTSRSYLRFTFQGREQIRTLLFGESRHNSKFVEDRVETVRRFALPIGIVIANLLSLAIIIANWNRR